MGYAFASDLADNFDLSSAVRIHLQSNCFPPVPSIMVEPALAAIEAVNDGEPYTLITLPEGVTSNGLGAVDAGFIVNGLHLDAFLG